MNGAQQNGQHAPPKASHPSRKDQDKAAQGVNMTDLPNEALAGALDPLGRVLRRQGQNNVLALAVGTVISTVVVKAVDQFTTEMFRWGNASPVFKPILNRLHVKVLGATLDLPHLLGIIVYVVLALVVLSFVVFVVMEPLLRDDDPV